MYTTLLGLIALFSYALDSHSWPAGFRFEQLSPDQGLSQSQVNAILQDRNGFMWFATNSGLNRYDGYDFKIYKNNPDDPKSLSNNAIISLYEARDGMLWVGTRGGLNRLDPMDPGMCNISYWRHDPDEPRSLSGDHVYAIHEDRTGKIWVGTERGLNRFDPRSETFEHWFHELGNPNSLSTNAVNALDVDGKGRLWVGTYGGGLNLLDPGTGIFTHWRHDPKDPQSLSADIITTLFRDGRKVLWIGTRHNGLNRFDETTGTFRRWRHDPGNEAGLGNDTVRSIHEGRGGRLWIGTWGDGLDLFDRRSETFVHYRHDPGDIYSLGSDFIRAVYRDRTGVLWVSPDGTGVSKTDVTSARFRHYTHHPSIPDSLSSNNISSLYSDRSGTLWVGTWDNGLNRFDRDRNRYQHFLEDPSNPRAMNTNTVYCILEDTRLSSYGLWVGTSKGLSLLDRNHGSFKHWLHDPNDPASLGQYGAFALLQDHEGRFWIGTYSGLNLMDRERGTFRRYNHDPEDPNSISENQVRTLYEDRAGALWIGTYGGGLNRLESESGIFTRYMANPESTGNINSNQVLAIYEDEQDPGILWLGTYGGGLNRLDVLTGKFMSYTEQNSELCNNEVCGILGGGQGVLWISTTHGLSRFDPKTGVFRNYDVADGLQSSEFNIGAFHQSRAGELFFGGIHGITVFSPDDIKDNPLPPELVLTGFKLFNKPVIPGPGTPLRQHISRTKDVVLEHGENDLSFEFVALHYTRPEKNSHSYKLENYDHEWNHVGSHRSARYTNLDPGEYVFRVKGANSDGVSNEEGISVRVLIKQPWWRTSWAYLGYLLGALLSALLIDRVQRARFIQQERRKAEMQGARLRAEAAESHAKAAEAQAQALQAEYERQELERKMLEAENTRKTRELEEARALQLSMLPKSVPVLPLLEIAVHMETATEVGGDYYDFKIADDGTLTAAIGDATGHGLQAGTMVAATKSLFSALTPDTEPISFLHKASRALKIMGFRKMYMALMLARFKERRMWLTSAGMPYALVFRDEARCVEVVEIKGTPLGSPADFPYKARVLDLNPGDTVLLMSDGLQERFNDHNEMLGCRRIIEWFSDLGRESPDRIIEALVEAGKTWAAGRLQDDDMTFMAIKVK